jgi:hypothetical protein
MRKEKDLAIKLRKSGKSYGQISKQLNVPKSTLSYWLSNIELSEKNKEKIYLRAKRKSCETLIRINKNQTFLAQERAKKIRKEAQSEVFELAKNRLFLVGTSLYWAEGYKKGATGSKWKGVDFTEKSAKFPMKK